MRRSEAKRYRPTCAQIDLGAIRRNARRLSALAREKGVELIAVVKADGYGHGAFRVAGAALEGGASSLAVALPEEGIALRQAGINSPILVMGAFIPGTADVYARYDLSVTVTDSLQAKALVGEAKGLGARFGVHLKIDTGMGRLGVLPSHAQELATEVHEADSLKIEGVYSHLATGDEPDLTYAHGQLRTFEEVLLGLYNMGVHPPQRHILNTGGLLQHAPGSTNMARVGLALYGLSPSKHLRDVLSMEPAMTFRTRVNGVKQVPRGTYVSYGRRFRTSASTNLATIPVGYADGMSRLLSGRVSVLIRGERYPVVGSICMDQAVVDIGDAPVAPGDDVVLFGREGDQCILPDEWADALGTINYEIVCMVSARVPRVYLDA